MSRAIITRWLLEQGLTMLHCTTCDQVTRHHRIPPWDGEPWRCSSCSTQCHPASLAIPADLHMSPNDDIISPAAHERR